MKFNFMVLNTVTGGYVKFRFHSIDYRILLLICGESVAIFADCVVTATGILLSSMPEIGSVASSCKGFSVNERKYVTGSGKTGLIATITDIHFLPVRESCTHALPRNTKYLIIDGQVCFYRRLFTDAVKPPGCISWPWRALMGLHGVPACSSRQSWPPLWILPVCVPCWGHNTAA